MDLRGDGLTKSAAGNSRGASARACSTVMIRHKGARAGLKTERQVQTSLLRLVESGTFEQDLP